MTIYVFAGPTLSVEECRAELQAEYLPPVAQGEVYRVALERPTAIGIIDGYFERMPAVWHKEILWAMSQGIRVYGSASMGALRAAELSSFGMVGVGRIFENFASGALEDDDEVAVAHASAENGYRALSEAMVNIRATVSHAVAECVISPFSAEVLLRIAKATFYADRCYPEILGRGLEEGVPRSEIEALRGWLPQGMVNQKRADALAMLRVMRAEMDGDHSPFEVTYHFEHTGAWAAVVQSAGRQEPTEAKNGKTAGADSLIHALLEELQISGRFPEARRGAIARLLAAERARAEGRVVEGPALGAAIAEFRRERGLLTEVDFKQWLREQGVRDAKFFEDEAHIRWVGSRLQNDLLRGLLDHLRWTGELGTLLSRARDKNERLQSSDASGSAVPRDETGENDLVRRYFAERLARSTPVDVRAYALEAGFEDESALRRAIHREFAYLHAVSPKSADSKSSPSATDG